MISLLTLRLFRPLILSIMASTSLRTRRLSIVLRLILLSVPLSSRRVLCLPRSLPLSMLLISLRVLVVRLTMPRALVFVLLRLMLLRSSGIMLRLARSLRTCLILRRRLVIFLLVPLLSLVVIRLRVLLITTRSLWRIRLMLRRSRSLLRSSVLFWALLFRVLLIMSRPRVRLFRLRTILMSLVLTRLLRLTFCWLFMSLLMVVRFMTLLPFSVTSFVLVLILIRRLIGGMVIMLGRRFAVCGRSLSSGRSLMALRMRSPLSRVTSSRRSGMSVLILPLIMLPRILPLMLRLLLSFGMTCLSCLMVRFLTVLRVLA